MLRGRGSRGIEFVLAALSSVLSLSQRVQAQESKPGLENITLTEAEKQFFPLAQGNEWTYSRTLHPDVDIPYVVRMLKKDEAGTERQQVFFDLLDRETAPLESEETYTITGPVPDTPNAWQVRFTGTLPRDGRYGLVRECALPQFAWMYLAGGVTEVADRSCDKTANPQTVNNSVWPTVLREGLFLNISEKPLWQVGAAHEKETVSVPAGTFEGCLRVVTLVKGVHGGIVPVLRDGKKPVIDEWNGFCTTSWYAPGVGLVKEEQRNREDIATYTLSLQKYRVHQP